MIFDTDILIWYFKGNPKAVKAVDSFDEKFISIITYLELLQGIKNQTELKTIRDFLSEYSYRIIPLHENIGHRASLYMEQFTLSHGMHLADALIAATAVDTNKTLYTGNKKHYSMIKELNLKLFHI